MKIKHLISFIIVGLVLIGSANSISKVLAQETTNTADIQYPIEELGGCESEAGCRAYCDKSVNTNACFDFAQKNNLMSGKEIQQAKKFLATGEKGPGGCVGKDVCEQYCNDIGHINECISYAEKNNLMSPQELEEAKKVQSAIDKGVKPPACGNKKECDTYCEDPNHMEECITFGVAAGFIQGKELEDSQKMLAALKKGVKPPPCKGKDACDVYCSNPNNIEVCMNFAIEAGMMSEEEKANSQKMLQAIKKGIKPPACKGREECDAFCSSEEHAEECINFSVAAGMMSEKEAVMARKTGGKGPGGCVGKDACDAFCNNTDNQEICFNFAKDNGMIPEEDLKRMEEGKQQMKQTLEQAPIEVIDCLETEVGADTVGKMKNGMMPPKEMGDKMQTCFQKMGPPNPGEPGSGGMIPPAGQVGPGGCKTAEECQTYCGAHPDECKDFGSSNKGQQFAPGTGSDGNQPGPGDMNPGGQMMPQQAGPGGCKGPEECKIYCESNPEECKNFQPNQNPQVQQQFAPGTGPTQCEGENCLQQQQNQNQQPQQQFAPGTNPTKCEGSDCPQQLPPPPPGASTNPGAGGNFAPGDMVPQLQPVEQQNQQPQQPVPSDNPLPGPGPGSLLNSNSFIGSILNFFTRILSGK